MRSQTGERWKSGLRFAVACIWFALLILAMFGNRIAHAVMGWWFAAAVAAFAAFGLLFASLWIGWFGRWPVAVMSAGTVLMLGAIGGAEAQRLLWIGIGVATVTFGLWGFRHAQWRKRFARYRAEYLPPTAQGELELEKYLSIQDDERLRACRLCLNADRESNRTIDTAWSFVVAPMNLLFFLAAVVLLLASL